MYFAVGGYVLPFPPFLICGWVIAVWFYFVARALLRNEMSLVQPAKVSALIIGLLGGPLMALYGQGMIQDALSRFVFHRELRFDAVEIFLAITLPLILILHACVYFMLRDIARSKAPVDFNSPPK